MDVLSQLLSLSRMQTQLDVRCLLAGAFVLAHDHAPSGQAVFHLLLSGACQLQTDNGTVVRLHEGDFVLLSQGSSHTLSSLQDGKPAPVWQHTSGMALPVRSNTSVDHEEEVDLLCGRIFYANGAGTLLAQAMPPLLHVNLHNMDLLRTLATLLRDEAANNRPGASTILDALGQVLFTLALRACGMGAQGNASVLALAADTRLGPSVQTILAQPDRPWTIASLGDLVGMSRATYARHFLDKAGMTVGNFLQKVRMMHACELLGHTRRSLSDIAQAVGYQSEAAFGKTFRQIIGSTPGQWRRQCTAS